MSCEQQKGCTVIGVFKPKGGRGAVATTSTPTTITTNVPVTILSGQTVSMNVVTADGQPYTVTWGDGSVTTHASGTTATHVYTADFTGNAVVTSTGAATVSAVQAPAPTGMFTSLHATIPAGQSVNITITTADASAVTVAWGDGNTAFFASGTSATHTYNTAFSGDIEFTTTADMTVLYHTVGNWDYDLATLPRTLIQYAALSGAVTGDIGGMPPTMEVFNLVGSNTVSGNISDIPSTVFSALMQGSNTIDTTGASWGGATTDADQVYYDSTVTKTVTQLDNLLIALDNDVTTWVSNRLIDINGSGNPTPSATAAITSLQAKGVTILMN